MTTAAPTEDRRERRRRRTREDIARIALELADDRGYDNVTVDDIADAADIAPRTFFRYFPTKDDICFTDHAEKLERLRSALAARPPEEPLLASLREAVLEVMGAVELDRDRTLLKQRLIERTPGLRAINLARQRDWFGILVAAVAARLDVDPERDLRPSLVAAASIGALQVAVDRWTTSTDADLPSLVEEAFALLDGMAALDR